MWNTFLARFLAWYRRPVKHPRDDVTDDELETAMHAIHQEHERRLVSRQYDKHSGMMQCVYKHDGRYYSSLRALDDHEERELKWAQDFNEIFYTDD